MSLGIELVAGTLLAVLCVALVLEPMFGSAGATAAAEPQPVEGDDWDADIALAATPRARALAALREIEFDRETGKLDDNDYDALKARYTREAIGAMRAEEADATAVAQAGSEDELLDRLAEARIAKARAEAAAPRGDCPTCGPRPEADATFCSKCGRRLAA